ncbi:LysR family transcriptional regulator [Litorivicinus lipolyticus]|uniref:LysR family transcriptional regulator n=1 Tax=Litorivicinus lipolyticus TaxID=418701 RepID=A0A5Q2QDK6_9GAMM|nr:LysR substrate-binding domain-containing protein [Litorivicinus lipolyticus]QGG80412.1 LysR family transcriptional regulator [Litorivicinus lipolyticus]
MNLSHLKAFLEIAELGSFQRSAERLHITQSTISARIKTLEDQLGQTLFQRHRDGAVLTPHGHKLVRHAQSAVQAWEQAKQQLALPEQLDSMLAIGVQTDLWNSLLKPWLGRIKQTHPDIGLTLRSDYSEALLAQLHEGRLDAAITYRPSRLPGFHSSELIRDDLMLVSTYPRPAQLDWREDYVFVDWGADFRRAHQAAYPTLRAPALTVGSFPLALDWLNSYGGSTFLPERIAKPLIDSGALHAVAGAPRFAHTIYLVRARDTLNPALDGALDLLRAFTETGLRGQGPARD